MGIGSRPRCGVWVGRRCGVVNRKAVDRDRLCALCASSFLLCCAGVAPAIRVGEYLLILSLSLEFVFYNIYSRMLHPWVAIVQSDKEDNEKEENNNAVNKHVQIYSNVCFGYR